MASQTQEDGGKKEKVPLSPLEFLREDERSSKRRRRRKRRRRWKRFISRIHPMTAEEGGGGSKVQRRTEGKISWSKGFALCLPKKTAKIAIEKTVTL